jgi:SAM-dependent methyltransferase
MPLTWSMPVDKNQPVIWDGRSFIRGESRFRILQYPVSVEGWDSHLAELMFSENDAQRPIGIASRKHVMSQVRKYIPENNPQTILEVGCSTGLMLNALQREFPDALVAGSDVEYQSLLSIADKYPAVPLFQLDLAEAEVPENKFNCIVSLNVLEHIKDDKAAVMNIAKLLKPKGILVLELPAGASLYDVFDKQLRHYRRYDMGNLVSMLESCGLKIIEKSHLGFLPYPVFWLRKKLNRRLLNADEKVQAGITSKYLHQTKRSKILSVLFRIEEQLRKVFYLPYGIRCLVTCRKLI